MKNYQFAKKFSYLLLLAGLVCFGLPQLQAKTIKLYDQPQANAKEVGSVDSAVGVMTIYSPKNSDWIKVADPRNGDVGWVKSAELGNSGFSYHVITTGDGKQNYQVIFGNSPTMNPEQVTQMMQQVQHRQEAIQKNMQQIIQQMFNDPLWSHSPMIMPIVVIPEKNLEQNVKTEAKAHK